MGYSASEVTAGGVYKMVIAPFEKIDKTAVKLGELTPVAVDPSKPITQNNFNVQILDAEGNVGMVADDPAVVALIPAEKREEFLETYGETDVTFVYHPASASWYLYGERSKRTVPMNDYEIPLGRSVLLCTAGSYATGANLVFAGQVLNEGIESPVTAAGEYISTGNVAPTNMKLSDFTPMPADQTKAITQNNFNVQLLDEEGNVGMVKDNPDVVALIPAEKREDFLETYGETDVTFVYHPASASWYLYGERSKRTVPMNDFVIKGGQGFLLCTAGSYATGAYLILPSALTKPVED